MTGAASGKYLDNAVVYVEYELPTSITSRPQTNNKAYSILNARGMWKFADDATQISATNGLVDMSDEAYQWAIIYYNDNYYLYSVNKKGYLTANKTLTYLPSDNEQVDLVATSDDSYP